MAAREEKGIREPGNSGPADPPLRSGLSLRFETLLVGIADRFHRSLRSPVRQSLRSLRLCPALRLSGGRPRLPRRICPQVDDAAKGAARRWITWRLRTTLSEEDGPSAGPLRGPVGAVPDMVHQWAVRPAELARELDRTSSLRGPLAGPASDARHLHPEKQKRHRHDTRPEGIQVRTPATAAALRPTTPEPGAEPKPWIPYGERVTAATPAESFGKVDFDDEESGTVCVAYLERDMDGGYTLHVAPLSEDRKVRVAIHYERGVARVNSAQASAAAA